MGKWKLHRVVESFFILRAQPFYFIKGRYLLRYIQSFVFISIISKIGNSDPLLIKLPSQVRCPCLALSLLHIRSWGVKSPLALDYLPTYYFMAIFMDDDQITLHFILRRFRHHILTEGGHNTL